MKAECPHCGDSTGYTWMDYIPFGRTNNALLTGQPVVSYNNDCGSCDRLFNVTLTAEKHFVVEKITGHYDDITAPCYR